MPFAASCRMLHAVGRLPVAQTAWTTVAVRSGDTCGISPYDLRDGRRHRREEPAWPARAPSCVGRSSLHRSGSGDHGTVRRQAADGGQARCRRVLDQGAEEAGRDQDAAGPRRAVRRDDVGDRPALPGQPHEAARRQRIPASSTSSGQRIFHPRPRCERQALPHVEAGHQDRDQAEHATIMRPRRPRPRRSPRARPAGRDVRPQPGRDRRPDPLHRDPPRRRPQLVLAIGWLESGWYRRAVSSTNAVGVMQIMPVTGTWASQLSAAGSTSTTCATTSRPACLVLEPCRPWPTLVTRPSPPTTKASTPAHEGLYAATKAYVANVKAIRPTRRASLKDVRAP